MELENRMISAEWLKSKCYEICDEYNTERLYIDRIIDEIDNAPDVEVVHARWVVKGQDIFCSNCDSESEYNAWGASSFSTYCPNCGAKMDGSADNEID